MSLWLVAAPAVAAECQDLDGVGSACVTADGDLVVSWGPLRARTADGSASTDASVPVAGL